MSAEVAVRSLRHVLLSIADDELVLGHRDSEWTAFAPFIEEDVALASIAQDEISHASVFLNLLKDAEGTSGDAESDPDRLVFLRDAKDFRNARLLERPNGDFAYTSLRHLAYDVFDDLRLQALAGSSHGELAATVDRLRREERYHLLHGRTWLARLASADGEPRDRVERALASVMADAAGLFEETEDDEEAVRTGLFPGGPASLAEGWVEAMRGELAPFGLERAVPSAAELVAASRTRPAGAGGAAGGRRGDHTDDLTSLLAALGEVYRSDPQAAW